MAEDQDKQDEKFDFTREGEAIGYISLDQGRVLAMRTARETPGAYGSSFGEVPMAFEVLEAEETEDHYVITLSFRPQGEYAGRPGQEQFFIEKEGTVAHRQVLALPRRRRRIPAIPAALGLVLIAAIVVGVVVGVTRGGGNVKEPAGVAIASPESSGPAEAMPAATATQLPTPIIIVSPAPTDTPPTPTPEASPASDDSEIQPLVSDAGLEYIPVRYSGGLEIFAGQRVAQSFTVPADGAITGVELLNLGHETCQVDAALDFRLMATVDGYPGKPVIHSVSIPAKDVDLEHGGFRIDLPEAWPVGAYQTLALELSTAADPTTGDNCYYGWNGESPGTYRGGQAFASHDGGQTWLPDRKDLAFRVFYEPEAAIQSAGSDLFTFEDDFEGGPSDSWNHGTINTDHLDAFTKFLGRFSNQTVSLTLNNLPTHSEVKLQFDLYLLDSWDGDDTGCCGPDSFRVGFGSSRTNLLDKTFGGDQAPCDQLGFNLGFCDTIYKNLGSGFSFPHTGDSLTLSFSAKGLQDLDDESWGIDNVKVTLTLGNGFPPPPGTPAEVPTPMPTPRPKPTPTPTPVPTPTSTPPLAPSTATALPVSESTLLATFQGIGSQITLPFEVNSSPWILEVPPSGGLRVIVLNDTNSASAVIDPSQSGEIPIYGSTGSLHLRVEPDQSYGNQPWSITVKVP